MHDIMKMASRKLLSMTEIFSSLDTQELSDNFEYFTSCKITKLKQIRK